MGNWDWPDLYNRRRPGGASSLPDDSAHGPQNLTGEGEGGDGEQTPRAAKPRRERERRSPGEGRGRPLQDSTSEPISTRSGSGGSGSSSGSSRSGTTCDEPTSEPAPSPEVLAQVAALKQAAARGDAFCEE